MRRLLSLLFGEEGETRMGWYTDWFAANEAEAEAVASIATGDEHSFSDWPHLSMKSIGGLELLYLWGVLRGDPENTEDVTGKVVFIADEQEGPAVSQVETDFLTALEALKREDVAQMARSWQKCEVMAAWEPAEVEERLREMVAFVRMAKREGKPVLQLDVW